MEDLILIQDLNDQRADLYALCLFDSGRTNTLINQHSLPPSIAPKNGPLKRSPQLKVHTYVYKFEILRGKEYFFSDFCKSRSIPEMHMRLFDSLNSRYDVIIGRDILANGFILDHARNIVSWDGLSIVMTKASNPSKPITTSFSCSLTASEVYATASTEILHAKYEQYSPEDIVQMCSHLSSTNQSKLLKLLSKFSRLFPGTLGWYVHCKFTIQLKDPNVQPIFCNPYPIPLIHQKVFQNELNHLIEKKVLRRIPRRE